MFQGQDTQRQANFVLSKTISIADFALLIDKIEYAPNFGDRKNIDKKRNNQFMYKLGFVGFAFGNIMLWNFLEYLGIKDNNPEPRSFTSCLLIILRGMNLNIPYISSEVKFIEQTDKSAEPKVQMDYYHSEEKCE